jgi:ABC-2 type transport system permease protein
MKTLDIAFKNMQRSFRSASAIMFMFILPLLIPGMFYIMFGNLASGGEFSLPRTKVIIANLDEGGPKFQVNTKGIPGGAKANTMGELVVNILQSEEMTNLIDPTLTSDAAAARAAVDSQKAQVAIIIPPDFSKQFADVDGKAVLEFYQDPTLTIGPSILRAILNRFMAGMAGVKIAVNVFLDGAEPQDYYLTGEVVQQYLTISLAQTQDVEEKLLDLQAPPAAPAQQDNNQLLRILSPIVGGMLVFYAFYTGAAMGQSLIKEEEEHTLPRLFTTPTPQATILTGTFLAVLFTVTVQVTVLLIATRLVFGVQWGDLPLVIIAAGGTVCIASSFGICLNSFLKTARQGTVVFGGVLTVTGMVGMVFTFTGDASTTTSLSNSVSLLVPQGWAVRGFIQTLNAAPVSDVLLNTLVMLILSAIFFAVGVWRFQRRYA